MSAERIEELRAQWDRAINRDRPSDAATALAELEKLESDEPRWSQRLGEAQRRLGKMREAEEAFVRAAERYARQGFMPRAIAMAKLVISMNPAQADLLSRLEPKKAPAVAPPLRMGGAPAPDAPDTAIAPAAAAPPPAPLAPPPPPARPVPLARAEDSQIDEVRFTDVEGDRPSIDIILADVSDVEIFVDVASVSPPEPEEPSIDRMGAMATFRLFASLSREALLDLAEASELVELAPGAMMMARNEPAQALYAIIDGVARVVVRGSPEIRVREGDVVGESCLLDEGERQADVRCDTAVMALRIEKAKLDAVTARHEAIGDALFQLLARRLLMNLMHASPLFASFEPRVRLELAQLFEVRRAEPGTILSERGKRSDGLYVLLAGNVSATSAAGDDTRVARGSAFGHASLVGASGSDATVTAVTEAVLLRLPASKFSSLAMQYPPVLALLAETADQPLQASIAPNAPE